MRDAVRMGVLVAVVLGFGVAWDGSRDAEDPQAATEASAPSDPGEATHQGPGAGAAGAEPGNESDDGSSQEVPEIPADLNTNLK
jgi:hypothetical protein